MGMGVATILTHGNQWCSLEPVLRDSSYQMGTEQLYTACKCVMGLTLTSVLQVQWFTEAPPESLVLLACIVHAVMQKHSGLVK